MQCMEQLSDGKSMKVALHEQLVYYYFVTLCPVIPIIEVLLDI